ncbi:MAG: hypothetical protein IJ058_01190 [Lachnospiraceae bacterium]|nr:hypothetical protein [Lachnospiraceae bacterium]
MLFRKKLISNFIWILAMIVLIVMGAQYAFLYGIDFLFAGEDSYLAQITSVSYTALDAALLIWIAVFIGICFGVFFLFRAISKAIHKKLRGKKNVINIIHILLACLVFLSGIFVRGYMMLSDSGAVILTDSTYYDAAAAMLEGEYTNAMELSVHGASHAYIMMLYFIMQFVGDRAIAAVLLQIIIQVITMILVFTTFKSFVNYTCGLVTSLGLALSPLYTSKLLSSSPGCFTAMLVVAAMYLVSCVLRTDGKQLKTVLGLILGLIAGYLMFLDMSVILCLIPWLFCLIYEVGDPEKKGALVSYLLMPCGMLLGLVLSLIIDGIIGVGGVAYAAENWLNVITSTALPEYSLLDSTSGAAGLIQCLIMVGFASMTVMGTVGRDRIEYELTWILMFACAITPLTKIGYLHDSMTSFIMYMALTGAGVSAMLHVRTRSDRIAKTEAGQHTDTPGQPAAVPVSQPATAFAQIPQPVPAVKPAPASFAEPAPVPAAYPAPAPSAEPVPVPAAKPAPASAVNPVPVPAAYPAPAPSTEPAPVPIVNPTEAPMPEPVPSPGYKTVPQASDTEVDSDSDGIIFESLDEIAPAGSDRSEQITSIPWASIRDMDDDDPLSILKDTETGEDTVLTSGNRNYDVVVEGADFVTEEMFMPEEDEEDSEPEEKETENISTDPGPTDPEPAREFDRSTMQVDDLPGMIPNPLPLPKKKPHVEMSYDRDFDDFDDGPDGNDRDDYNDDFDDLKDDFDDTGDEMDWDLNDDQDIDDGEDDFDL